MKSIYEGTKNQAKLCLPKTGPSGDHPKKLGSKASLFLNLNKKVS